MGKLEFTLIVDDPHVDPGAIDVRRQGSGCRHGILFPAKDGIPAHLLWTGGDSRGVISLDEMRQIIDHAKPKACKFCEAPLGGLQCEDGDRLCGNEMCPMCLSCQGLLVTQKRVASAKAAREDREKSSDEG